MISAVTLLDTVMVFLYTLLVVISLLLIGIVLIQPAKSGGMGAAFGGIGESVFGAKAGSHLTKATVIMTALFFVLALTLAALIGRTQSGSGSSAKESEISKTMKEMDKTDKPAAPPSVNTQPEKTEKPKPAAPASVNTQPKKTEKPKPVSTAPAK